MAWYLIFLNVLFVAIVLGGIVGSHVWAVATQQRDWPAGQRETATAVPTPVPATTARIAAEPVLI